MPVPETMTFIAADGAGEPDVLKPATGPVPRPKRHEALIRVLAAGVNRPDVQQRKGLYPPPADASPLLGLEVAGEVAAIGDDVTDLKVGDKVCALTNGGGYAEYATAPATQCLPWPNGYDAVHAAALPENYFTVWANVFMLGRLGRGETMLVHGGTSGIGLTAIQLGAAFGSTVYATAGSAEKCAACEKYAAAAAINYREADFAGEIKRLTEGRGVDVVLDMVGAPYTVRNIRSLATEGRLVQIAFMQGSKIPEFDLMPIMIRRLTVTGSTMRPRSVAQKGAIAEALREQVWPVLNHGRCGPVIHEVFPLARASAAHALMETSTHIGKIMLSVAD
jgi:NADPH2:quinone reductase